MWEHIRYLSVYNRNSLQNRTFIVTFSAVMIEKRRKKGEKLSKSKSFERREQLIKDMENIMIVIIKDEIPKRKDLNKRHTLKDLDYFIGADICVVGSREEVKSKDFGWKSYDYILTNFPYEISWILCEIRDAYQKNEFYDAFIKYPLFGRFAHLHTKITKERNTFNSINPDCKGLARWMEWNDAVSAQNPWILEKSILLDIFENMLYSYEHFLPDNNHNPEDILEEEFVTDLHIGAKS